MLPVKECVRLILGPERRHVKLARCRFASLYFMANVLCFCLDISRLLYRWRFGVTVYDLCLSFVCCRRF